MFGQEWKAAQPSAVQWERGAASKVNCDAWETAASKTNGLQILLNCSIPYNSNSNSNSNCSWSKSVDVVAKCKYTHTENEMTPSFFTLFVFSQYKYRTKYYKYHIKYCKYHSTYYYEYMWRKSNAITSAHSLRWLPAFSRFLYFYQHK